MESEPRYTLTDSDILHFALCLRSRHTADLSANEAIEHWRTDHGITPAPVDGVQAAAEAAARALTPYIAEDLQQPRSPGYGPSWGADHIRAEATRAAMSWQPYKDFRVAFIAEVERLLAADTAPQEQT